MPSWMPGEDYLINFQKGDPYTKLDEGYARLPGSGYAALHPELEGVDPEKYDDFTRMKILADVAPYSRQYQTVRAQVEKRTGDNPELRAEYERVVDQVRQTRESTRSLPHGKRYNPRARGVEELSSLPTSRRENPRARRGSKDNQVSPPQHKITTLAHADRSELRSLPTSRRENLRARGGTITSDTRTRPCSQLPQGRRTAPLDPRSRTFQGPCASPFQPEQGSCPTPKAAHRRL